MLSASAVADSHPWRRQMRYLLGVVVFATPIAATHDCAHILPKLRHHPTRSEVWNISTFTTAAVDVIEHCSGNPVCLRWPKSTPPNVQSHVLYPRYCPETHAHLDPGSSRSGARIAGRVRLPSTCSQARICDETPRCSNNICAADENATQAGIQCHTASANQSSVSAGSADLTAATNRAIYIPALAIYHWTLRGRVADGSGKW